MTSPQSGAELTFGSAGALKNIGVLAHKAVTIDASALVRIRAREIPTGPANSGSPANSADPAAPSAPAAPAAPAAMSQVWVKTPFGPLAMRTVALRALPDDIVVTAADLKDIAARAFAQAKSSDEVGGEDAETALPYRISAQPATAWPGFLPVLDGWQTIDYVPAKAFRTLEKQAREVATESSGPLGLPTSLLDQKVLTVSRTADGAGAGEPGAQGTSESVVDITMRDVFALCAMGFIPEAPDEKEPVRVSSNGRWHRLDGRFGSVFTLESFGVLPLLS